jgi:hypothetical protein
VSVVLAGWLQVLPNAWLSAPRKPSGCLPIYCGQLRGAIEGLPVCSYQGVWLAQGSPTSRVRVIAAGLPCRLACMRT